jgi:hypothetical protein
VHLLGEGLRDEQAVKGIAMMKGECCQERHVTDRDIQQANAILFDLFGIRSPNGADKVSFPRLTLMAFPKDWPRSTNFRSKGSQL